MRAPRSEAPGRGASGHVASVNLSATHDFSKPSALEARLIAGVGIEGDAHAGATVRHRYARRKSAEQPNLRQVHLLGTELLDDLARLGHVVAAGELGENITTTGVDLLDLPSGTVLRLGEEAQIRLTGLRTPCRLIDDFQAGLMKKMWGVDDQGRRFRRAGVMAVVVAGGVIRPGDELIVVLPDQPWEPLAPV